ncbi:hypothetical protein FRB98_008550 [Tulasnella sp. 332]|nr:hypothetical protein FRB98_008550 [Tulasnella sp. 332]
MSDISSWRFRGGGIWIRCIWFWSFGYDAELEELRFLPDLLKGSKLIPPLSQTTLLGIRLANSFSCLIEFMSNCQDDITALDVELSSTLQGRVGGSAETTNLFNVIDRENVFGVNLTQLEDAKEMIKPWESRESMVRWGESSEDDEMIVHVPFTQNIRIRSVMVKLGRGELCPRRLRLYANSPNGISFSDDIEPTQDIALLEGAEGVTEYPVRISAFASVMSVTLFFSDSPMSERSRVYYIGFKGDSKKLAKEPGGKLDIPAANAADAPVDQLAERAAGAQSTAR